MSAQRALIGLAVTLAAAVVVQALGSAYDPGVADAARPVRFVVLALAAAWALPAIVKAPSSLRRALTPLHLGLAVLVALALASSLWSINSQKTFERSVTLGILWCVLVAVAVLVRNTSDAIRVVEAIAAGITIVVAASFVLVLVDHDGAVQGAFADANGGALSRFRGVTENPDAIASYGILGVPLLIALARTRTGAVACVWAAAAAATVASTVISGARGPAALVLLEAAVLLAPIARKHTRPAIALVLLAAVAIAVAVASDPHRASRAVRPGTIADLGGRTVVWRGATELTGHRPLQGYGFGTEELALLTYRDAHVAEFEKAGFQGSYAHESYLGLAVQVGVLGAALGTALVLFPLLALWRRSPFDRWWTTAIAAALAGTAINGLVSSYVFSVGNVLTPFFWVLATLAVSTPALLTRD
jgi:O-antigen ligase